jgi:pectate lyase
LNEGILGTRPLISKGPCQRDEALRRHPSRNLKLFLDCHITSRIYFGAARFRTVPIALALLISVAQAGLSAPLPLPEATPGIGTRSPKLADGRQRAFPTAEGFGAAARGGRGGAVIMVTNVEEAGEGSLRACIEAEGPRTCIFRTSGTITLAAGSLVVRNPYLTIAGETAPGDGIAIRNAPDQPRPSLEIHTHDVIVRHLRLRPGPHSVESCCSGALGLYTFAAQDIMIDHVSASWGSDETIDTENAIDVTFQWMLVAEPLLNGGPTKSDRARNLYVTRGGDVTIHHSLFTLGKFRNPQFQMYKGVADVVNNVHYSPIWDYVISLSNRWTKARANFIGNYKLSGAAGTDNHLLHLFDDSGQGFEIYLSGNYDQDYRPNNTIPEHEVLKAEWRSVVTGSPIPVPDRVIASPAPIAYESVLANAGATKPRRDSADRRYVQEVRSRTGALLSNDPEEVGGWPALLPAPAPVDSDGDGMPDDWELLAWLDPLTAADGNADKDGDGWTNLEEYLHEMAGDGVGMAMLGEHSYVGR